MHTNTINRFLKTTQKTHSIDGLKTQICKQECEKNCTTQQGHIK